MQHLWKLKLEWDSELPVDLREKWNDFRESLSYLHNLKVGRFVINGAATERIELHAFADASEKAYGTAVYVRSINSEGNILVKLLCSKSRVAPTKIVTVPRLELCAAKLACQLVQRIIKTINVKIDEIVYWSDSQVALSWIHGEPAQFKTFVGNRVQQIRNVSSPSQWRYINTKINPADLISRGMNAQLLITSELWFLGPPLLQKTTCQWPRSQFENVKIPEEEKGLKIVLNCTNNSSQDNHFINRIQHGNSFSKLQRIVAFVLRSIKLFKKSMIKKDITPYLLVSELDDALCEIIKTMQLENFKSEIEQLKAHGRVSNSSRLATLTPYLDKAGLLRVGGRLEAAELSHDAKHPLLLSGNHVFAKLLMNDLHVQHLHAGPQALLAFARQKYWITQGRNLARSVVNSCVLCTRAKPRVLEQVMGNLPARRVLPGRPFLTTAVDFCGPVWTHFKIRGKRPQKTYIAVFCCFVTKAVHLEVVSDLTTDAFIGALKRFVGRRGHCQHIHCDNGTNFVGANNKLQEIQHILEEKQSREKIANSCSQRGIQFHFNPPRSPHFGGLCEAAVKSFKQLFLKSVASASLTYEELCTVVTEVEAVLNSRPLTPLSCDPNDFSVLTPGHFLIGEPLTAVPDHELNTSNLSSLSRWKLVSGLRQEFWRRWSSENLSEVQKRVKWKKENPNIKEGTLVLIREDNLPALKWSLGRIIGTNPGSDGKIRVVDVKTSTGIFRRAIQQQQYRNDQSTHSIGSMHHFG